MELDLGDDQKLTRLTLIYGLGDFGARVIDLLREQLTVLPEALRQATHLVQVPAEEHLAGSVIRLRHDLTLIDNVNRIQNLGWRLAGGALQLHVQHFFVGSLDEIEQASSFVRSALKQNPADTFFGIGFCEDARALSRAIEARDLSLWTRVFLVSSKNSSGASVEREAVESSTAGMLLVSLLRDRVEQDASNTAFSTLGFAGYYGMTGPALEQLAAQVAHALVREHRTPSPYDEEIPEEVTAFVEAYDPKALGRRLLVDPDVQSPALSEELTVTPERIPAVPAWEEDILRVTLDRGDIGLELTERGKEAEWSTRIRAYARTFDMTVSYTWRLQVEAAALRLAQHIRETLLEAFQVILRRHPRSPAYARYALDRLHAALGTRLLPMRERPGDLDHALDDLDDAVAARPNPLALTLRLALWVIPALVAGFWIIGALYEGIRGTIFPILFFTVGTLLALGWLLWRLEKARTRVKDARDRALEIVTERQAAILSENVVGYLNDEVLPVLRAALSTQAERLLEIYNQTLETAETQLAAVLKEPLATPITFGPLLSKPEEYEQAFAQLGIDLRGWLEEAIQGGHLDPDQQDGALQESLTVRCRERLPERIYEVGLTYEALWNIRQACRGGDTLVASINALWRLATPLVDGTYAPDATAETQVILAPVEISTLIQRLPGDEVDFPKDHVQEIHVTPLLGCLRSGNLSHLKRSLP